MKKIKSLFWPLFALFLIVAFFLYPYIKNPTELNPKPYIVEVDYTAESHEAEKSNILLIGDRMAVHLFQFLDSIIENSRNKLKAPLKIHNWAKEGEGLHRTLSKVKSLEKFPDVIIYHGSTEEFFEKRFELEYRHEVIKNFQRRYNEKIHSLLLSFPFLAKFIYAPYQHTIVSREYNALEKYSSEQAQKIMETTYFIYTSEYRELVQFLTGKGVHLIVIPPPHNLDLAPKYICQSSLYPALSARLKEIVAAKEEGKIKAQIPQLKKLLKENVANAQIYYLLGQALKEQGSFRDAKSLLYRAQAFDCKLFRGNMIFNRIQMQIAERNKVGVIDFNKMVNNEFGKGQIFIDDIFPVDDFYNQLVKELGRMVQNILKI